MKKLLLPMLVSFFTLNSYATYQPLSFPYNELKNKEIDNPIIESALQNYIQKMQINDAKISNEIIKENNEFSKKIVSVKKRNAYRDQKATNDELAKVYRDEEKTLNKVFKDFIITETTNFNDFYNGLMNSPHLNEKDKSILKTSSIELLKKYQALIEQYNYLNDTINEYCFKTKDIEYGTVDTLYCDDMYNTVYGFVDTTKFNTAPLLEQMINQYYLNENKNNFRENLKRKVEYIKEQEFKYQ